MSRNKGSLKEKRAYLLAAGALVALLMIFNMRFSKSATPAGEPDTMVKATENRDNLRTPPKTEIAMSESDVGDPNSKIRASDEVKLSQEIFTESDPGESHVIKSIEDDKLKDRMIFHHYLKGKAGSVIEDMLMCHAYAFHNNAVYGGSCGQPESKEQAHADLLDAIGLRDVLHFSCPRDHDGDTIQRRSVIQRDQFRKADTRIWTPEYVDYLRGLVNYPPKHLSAMYTIAVQVRRGDITPCRKKKEGYDQYLPNSHYLSLIEEYKKDKPDARVIIFSQSKAHESFDVFHEKGYEVSLDDELHDIWREFLAADVLILSRSDFSMMPALVTKGTVVYTAFWNHPLRNWKKASAELLAQTNAEMLLLQEDCPTKNKWAH